MRCSLCGHVNPAGGLHCTACGTALVIACPTCGAAPGDGDRFCGTCGTALVPEAAPNSPGGALPAAVGAGRYQVHRFLGEGSKKRVYLAQDTRLGRPVALALLKQEGLDESGRARLQREAQSMGRLGGHPHVVTIHDIGEENDQVYIVTQYMAGGSVDDLLTRAPARRLPPADAVRIAGQICQALEHAHGQGIIHRDLKPGNVFLTEDGVVKLGDFGLAVALDRTRLTTEGAMVGTVGYMAPEQALGRPPDARSDLYALGAMLYEMVTGRPPFVGDDAVAVISQHINGTPVAPSWHNPAVPRDLEALILRLLAKAPGERPPSASAVRQAIAAVNFAVPAASGAAAAERTNPLDRLAGGAFVGREHEVAVLRTALDAALSGHGRIVLLGGEPGIGKTRTAEELATYAQLRDVQVLWGRCYEGEGAPAFWPWVQVIRAWVGQRDARDLLADMGPGAADIAQVVSVLRERLPDLPAPPALEPEHARFRLFDSVTTFLKSATVRTPIMLVLDDLHWADGPSLRLLEFLAREIEGARLLVIGTFRDAEVGGREGLARTLAEFARSPGSERLALRGLDEGEVARFIEATAGLRPPDALVAAVFRETEGNPFFMTEVMRLLVANRRLEHPEAVRSWSLDVPQGVREVVGRRMHTLSPETSHLLTLAAVIGREFRLDTLERLADLDADTVLERVEEAAVARVITEVTGTVGHYRFAHALIRETLYEGLIAARRARLHRRIGEVLEAEYAGREERHANELAHHFFQGIAGGADPQTAIRYAVQAAERAVAMVAYEEGARLYELALQALELAPTPDAAERGGLLLALGEAQTRAGDGPGARDTFTRAAEAARRGGSHERLARAALGFAGPWGTAGMTDESVVRLLEEALAVVGDGDGALRARLLARLAVELVWTGARERRLALSADAVAMARRLGDARALAFALYGRHWALLGPDRLEERLAVASELVEIAEQAGEKETALHGRTQRIQNLVELGDIAAVDEELARQARLAGELRQPLYLWYAALIRAMRAGLEGHFADGERLAYEALLIGQRIRERDAMQLFGAQTFPLADAQGKFEQLEAGLGPLTMMVAENPAVPAWRGALAYIYCRLGREAEARAEFELLAANDFRDIAGNMEWLVCINTLGLVCAMLSDTRRAATLYALLLPYAHRNVSAGGALTCFGSASRALGLLATTLGRFADAAAHFEAAIAMNARMGARPYVAWTQHDFAQMLLARDAGGDRRAALELLLPAVDTAEALGMQALLESGLRLKLRAQGLGPTDITTSVDAVAAAVHHERSDLTAHAAPDGTVTLLFTDIEGYTALTERLGDRGAQAVLRAHNTIVRRQVAAHGGFEVKSQGDGFMIAFAGARRALRCAVDLQRTFAAHAAAHPADAFRVRIGLHTGEVIREAGDFFGKHVIFAARVAARADGGVILVSQVVRELTESAGEFVFDDGRDVELKGLSGLHRLFAVAWQQQPAR